MKTTRRGYALIEMVLVIGMITILLGLCVGLIHALLKLDRAGRVHMKETTARARLARQFRQDVRSSTRSSPARADAEQLELERPDGPTVRYQVEDGRLLRTERARDQPERHEAFALPPRGSPRFQVRDEGGQVYVSVIVTSTPAPLDTIPRREFRIDAALGKDHRWTGTKEAEK